MNKYSIHIGIKNANIQDTTFNTLPNAELLAILYQKTYSHFGFTASSLIDCKFENFNDVVKHTLKTIHAHDLLVVTFNGHGVLHKTSGSEPDGYDEAWVFNDQIILDDELIPIWTEIANKECNLLIINDCCSGGDGVVFMYNSLLQGWKNKKIKPQRHQLTNHVLQMSSSQSNEHIEVEFKFSMCIIEAMMEAPANLDILFERAKQCYLYKTKISTPFIYPIDRKAGPPFRNTNFFNY